MSPYDQWKFKVRLIQNLYSEPVIREAIIKSLKGTAAELVQYLGLPVKVNDFLGKLDMVSGSVVSFDILMQSFYDHSEAEKIPAYVTHI